MSRSMEQLNSRQIFEQGFGAAGQRLLDDPLLENERFFP